MATSFVQTDTAASASARAVLCTGNSNNTDTEGRTLAINGTPGTNPLTLTVDISAADLNGFWFVTEDIDDYDGASGNWLTVINVTTSNHQITLDEVHLCHVASDYTAKTTMGGVTGLALNLGATGEVSVTVTQSMSLNIAAGDKIVCVYAFDNASSSMTQDIGFTSGSTITGPGNAATINEVNDITAGGCSFLGQVPTADAPTAANEVNDITEGGYSVLGQLPNVGNGANPSDGLVIFKNNAPQLPGWKMTVSRVGIDG